MFHVPAHKQTAPAAVPAQTKRAAAVTTLAQVVERIQVSEAAHASNVFHMYARDRVIASAQDSKRTVAL